jgi:hypothetical protein
MDSQAGKGWPVSFGIKRINGAIRPRDMAGRVAHGSDKEAGQRPNTKRSGSELISPNRSVDFSDLGLLTSVLFSSVP